MKFITRIVLRGLLSGEIKPEPQVFEYLRDLSERRVQRQSRILRVVPPTKPNATSAEAEESPQPPFVRESGIGGGEQWEGNSKGSTSCCRLRAVFTSDSPGRWVRVAAAVLAGFLVLGGGAADVLGTGYSEVESTVEAAVLETPAEIGVPAPVQIGSAVIRVLISGMHPFPSFQLMVSGISLAALMFCAGGIWFCPNRLFVMRPYERALQELEAAQFRARRGQVLDLPMAVRGILSDYLQAQFRFRPQDLDRAALSRALTGEGAHLTSSQTWLLKDLLNDTSNNAANPSRDLDVCEKASFFLWSMASNQPGR